MERGHEGTEISTRGIMLTMAAVGILGIAALLVSWIMLSGFERTGIKSDAARSPLASQNPAPPQPWLQPSPSQDQPRQPAQEMTAFRKREDLALGSYATVDGQRGVVQIPIDRAMQILAAPTTRPKSRPAPATPDREPTGGVQK